ncbi:hypothetical protein [Yoonia sp. SDW83-1]|uniref:hypothetical protein n=1 Tax=Yoonia sp. SDW83-1 TaxID=3366945 RepID=UPI00398C585F
MIENDPHTALIPDQPVIAAAGEVVGSEHPSFLPEVHFLFQGKTVTPLHKKTGYKNAISSHSNAKKQVIRFWL